MVGTTHFINAFLQRRDMAKVALIRLAAPATFGTPPLLSWADELREGASGQSKRDGTEEKQHGNDGRTLRSDMQSRRRHTRPAFVATL